MGWWQCELAEPKLKAVAASLRVFGFQFSVFGESQECVSEQRNSTPVSGGRRAIRTKSWLVYFGVHRLFDHSADGDQARPEACLKMSQDDERMPVHTLSLS